MKVEIEGALFSHRLCQFALPYSWHRVTVVNTGESFMALSTGFWALHQAQIPPNDFLLSSGVMQRLCVSSRALP